MVKQIPIVDLSYPQMLGIWRGIPSVDTLVVRIQDLISHKNCKPNSTFYQIQQIGGIHKFLQFKGKVILSLVMKDELISTFSPEMYAEVVNGLQPDYYITVDGETYEQKEDVSLDEIYRSFRDTCKLIDLCPHALPLGLIKGCSKDQILFHMMLFQSIGISDYVFHIADFARHGSSRMISVGKSYASLIRKHSNSLLLHGLGAQNRLTEFSFADGYITYNHFITAYYGKIYDGTNKIGYSGGFRKQVVRHNLKEMVKNVSIIEEQKKLFEGGVCQWEADLVEVEQVMQEQVEMLIIK